MNLQVCVPYQPCIFNCPMCVARGHKHEYFFDNLYKTDRKKYLKLFVDKLKSLAPNSDIILTGECDPTQDIRFCKDIIKTVRKYRPDLKIELQTHNYKYKGELDIDVLSYSITNYFTYLNLRYLYKMKKGINRIVILLTKEFEVLNNLSFEDNGFDQVTFKTLQHGESELINQWIDNNKLYDISNIKSIVRPWISIRIDESCQTATGRYEIFRSDGQTYYSWEERRKS